MPWSAHLATEHTVAISGTKAKLQQRSTESIYRKICYNCDMPERLKPGKPAHVYTLNGPIDVEGKTAAQMAVLFYLKIREIEGKGGATAEDIIYDSRLTERTVGTAVKRLRDNGDIN